MTNPDHFLHIMGALGAALLLVAALEASYLRNGQRKLAAQQRETLAGRARSVVMSDRMARGEVVNPPMGGTRNMAARDMARRNYHSRGHTAHPMNNAFWL